MIDANLKFKTVLSEKTKPRTMKLFLLGISQKRGQYLLQKYWALTRKKCCDFAKKIESVLFLKYPNQIVILA